MAKNTVIQKILSAHMTSGNPVRGERMAIRIDQTLTQDATGTMAYLELEAMGAEQPEPMFQVKYMPSQDDLLKMKEIGTRLGAALAARCE